MAMAMAMAMAIECSKHAQAGFIILSDLCSLQCAFFCGEREREQQAMTDDYDNCRKSNSIQDIRSAI